MTRMECIQLVLENDEKTSNGLFYLKDITGDTCSTRCIRNHSRRLQENVIEVNTPIGLIQKSALLGSDTIIGNVLEW